MTEIQGKSILVRVSARFELARVPVIESRLYELNSKVKRVDYLGHFIKFSALCKQRKFQPSKTAKLLSDKKVNKPYILRKISSL